MPRRDQEDGERRKREHEKDERRDREHEHREHERRERREREPENAGDDPRAHARIIERRWLGSPPPTAERYANALKQWQALPGAVSRPAPAGGAAGERPRPGPGSRPHAGKVDEGSKQ